MNINLKIYKNNFPIELFKQLILNNEKYIEFDNCIIKNKPLYKILIRDNFTCQCCGLKMSTLKLIKSDMSKFYHFEAYGKDKNKKIRFTKDHWKPKSKNGTNSLNNLITFCEKCNVNKSDRNPQEFIKSKHFKNKSKNNIINLYIKRNEHSNILFHSNEQNIKLYLEKNGIKTTKPKTISKDKNIIYACYLHINSSKELIVCLSNNDIRKYNIFNEKYTTWYIISNDILKKDFPKYKNLLN